MPSSNIEMQQVPFVNFPAQYIEEREEIHNCVERIFTQGNFVGGDEVLQLEDEISKIISTKHTIAVNSGTDALVLSMRALGIGKNDEVITTPNSFIASAAAIVAIGAKPVFVDVKPDQNINPDLVVEAITKNTKAIMPVHLTGRVAEMNCLKSLADNHGLFLIEDAAQSFGSQYEKKMSGSIGDVGCFSAHPLKNFNAAGDAGFITTNNTNLANRLKLIRNHGLKNRETVTEWGTVSRLDSLQAAFLRNRLTRIDSIIKRRRTNAALYQKLLLNTPVFCPPCLKEEFNTFHTFVVQVERRDELKKFLLDRGIETSIHYPTPIHLQPVASYLGYSKGDFPETERQASNILSLPINQYLKKTDIEYVSLAIKEFFRD